MQVLSVLKTIKIMACFQAESNLLKSPAIPIEMQVLMVTSAVSLQTHLVSKADSSQSMEATIQPLNSNAEANPSLETARRV